MSSSALTTENSAVVMIDHAVGFGNVFRSHDLSLHVNNTVGLARTAGVFGIPLVADQRRGHRPLPAAVQNEQESAYPPHVSW